MPEHDMHPAAPAVPPDSGTAAVDATAESAATATAVVDPASSSGPSRPGDRIRHPGITLALIVTCQLMVVLDVSVVNIALPNIRTALHFSDTSLSWVIDAYTLAFGGLLLLGGRVGDIMGRRRTFLSGLALFTAASLVGGLATSASWLLAARAVQGIGAAMASPNTLALIMSHFEGDERNRAIGVYSAASAAGGSLGLLAGGMLTDWVSWRWILFVNVPIGIGLLLAGPRFIGEPRRNAGRFDLSGALASTGGIALMVYGFVRAASDGWSNIGTVGAFVVAICLLVAFVRIESRAVQPIFPLRLLRHRNRAAAYLMMLLLPAAMFGMFYFTTLFLQDVRGYSPLRTGVAFLPLTLALFATARTVPRLLRRLPAKPLLVTGALLVSVAMLWFSRVSPGTSYLGGMIVPMMLFGVGAATTFVAMGVTILSEVDGPDAGAASGLLQTMQQTGGALGLAVLVTVFATVRPGTPGPAATAGATGDTLLTAAVFCVVALVVAAVGVRSVPVTPTAPAQRGRRRALPGRSR